MTSATEASYTGMHERKEKGIPIMAHLRHIAAEGAYNVRDLGGYPTLEGYSTDWNKLYRSDALNYLTETGWGNLRAAGVRTVIDLRSDLEAQAYAVENPSDILYAHISLMRQVDDIPPNGISASTSEQDVAGAVDRIIKSACVDYGEAVRENIDRCCEVLNMIVDRLDEGAVLFFCSAGKDRTGIIAALALTLAGVPHDDIVVDYMSSAVYNRSGLNKRIATLTDVLNLPKSAMDKVVKEGLRSDADTMDGFLEDLADMDIVRLLDRNGFGLQRQAELKTSITG